MLRKLMWLGVLLLFVFSAWLVWQVYAVHSVTITEGQIQERIGKHIDERFPVKGFAGRLVTTVSIKRALVHIKDDHVVVDVDVEGVLIGGKTFTVTAYSIGAPRYESGNFYFTASLLQLTGFTYKGESPELLVKDFANLFLNSGSESIAQKLAPKIEDVMTSIAEHAVERTLQYRPVYRLKDDVKGWLLRASLTSVGVLGDHIVVAFSLWQLTLSVCFGILMVIASLVLALGMIRYPFLGLTMIAIS